MVIFDKFAPHYDKFLKLFNIYKPQEIIQLLDIKEGLEILDIGGGTGTLAKLILRLTPQIPLRFTILDPSTKMLSYVQNPKIKTVVGEGEKIPFANDHFDRIITTDALHHSHCPKMVIIEAYRVLKPGGIFLVQEFDQSLMRVRGLMLMEKIFIGQIQKITPYLLTSWGRLAGFKGEIHPCTKTQFFWKGIKPNA
ncbi:MAG: methyltransferase domain-containing protein [Bacillota bacterium]